MKRTELSVEALADLENIAAYIARDNPLAADRVDRKLRAAIEQLAHNPSGRIGRVNGTFEKVLVGLP